MKHFLTLFIVICICTVMVQFIHGETLHYNEVTDDSNDNAEERIFNGTEARSGQFPWMAGVTNQKANGNYNKWRCGGALISSNLILTARHCMDAKTKSYRITLGSTLAGEAQDGDGKVIRYAPAIQTSIHGRALIIRMSEPVEFTDKIQPVSLPTSVDDYLGPNVSATVSGWGYLKEHNGSPQSDKLMYTTMETISNDHCREWYSIKDDEVCYLSQNSTTCGGDSGSPVVTYINNVAVHVGIHNAGEAIAGIPSIAIRTSLHVDWIKSEIRRLAP